MSSTGNTTECQDSGTPESAASAAVADTSPPQFSSSSSPHLEPLSCTTCRARKLKCDRVKPICTRCAKAPADCVYPGGRRKPVSKRRNVKELEARLAQVEGLLQGVGKSIAARTAVAEGPDDDLVYGGDVDMDDEDAIHTYAESTGPTLSPNAGRGDGDGDGDGDADGAVPFEMPMGRDTRAYQDRTGLGALVGLGMSESLPPSGMIEDLHDKFFHRHNSYVPIIHPSRYLRSFYSPPHMKPPMSLQYIIWALAACGHDKYDSYHDIFYRRARMYVEADEMKGVGEHFITVRHAQALILLATYEARMTLFARSSMDVARAVRLACMMGLHRIDGGMGPMRPTLAPATSWLELEERRRTFWGAYCIDGHASIATGWPSVIDKREIFTRLPCSEEAFNMSTDDTPGPVDEEKTPTLEEALDGAPYSSFAGTIIICHMYTKLLKHIHRPTADERSDNVENGAFWKRHRALDDLLTTVFMYLPKRLCVDQACDAASVHTNMNLHAAVICLHHAAVARIDQHNLPETLRMASRNRLKAAADEIVNMIRMTSHTSWYDVGRNPLVPLSFYISATAYISLALDNPTMGLSEPDRANLIMVTKAMDAVAKNHIITRMYLQQIRHDIQSHGLTQILGIPNLVTMTTGAGLVRCHVPIVAQSRVTCQLEQEVFVQTHLGPVATQNAAVLSKQTYWRQQETSGRENPGPNKRKRVHAPAWTSDSAGTQPAPPLWQKPGIPPRMLVADAALPDINLFLPDRTATPPSTAQHMAPPPASTAAAATNGCGVASNPPPSMRWGGGGPLGTLVEESLDMGAPSPSPAASSGSATNPFSPDTHDGDTAPDLGCTRGSLAPLMGAVETNMASSPAGDQQGTPKAGTDMTLIEGILTSGQVLGTLMQASDIQEIMRDNMSWDWCGGGVSWNDGQTGNDRTTNDGPDDG